jgi:hypothetical protein
MAPNTKKRNFDKPWAEDSQNDQEVDGEAVTGGGVLIPTKILDSMLANIRSNKAGGDKLNKCFEKRKLEDNKSFAALREEADFNVNKSKQDRVVVFGLTLKTPLPASKPDSIKALKVLVMQQFLKISQLHQPSQLCWRPDSRCGVHDELGGESYRDKEGVREDQKG